MICHGSILALHMKKISKRYFVSTFKILVLAASLTLVACSAPRSSVIAGSSDAIVGGQDVASGAEISTGIVGIYDHKVGAICTGTLLENNIVLTAAHCIGSNDEKMYIVFGTDMFKILESQDDTLVHQYVRQVTSTRVHKDWNPEIEATGADWEWNDIALIKFKGSIPQGFKPAKFLTDRAALSGGKTVTLAGYGVSKIKISVVDPKSVKDLDKAIENGEVYCNQNKSYCEKEESTGDGLLRSVEVNISKVLKTEVVVNQRDGKGSCNGDSGGPAFVQIDGQFYLWGVTSRGDASCNLDGIYTNALNYMDWIQKTSGNMK
jgi:secreted trypsin-like serine protease